LLPQIFRRRAASAAMGLAAQRPHFLGKLALRLIYMG
jgi:hypothetical protein